MSIQTELARLTNAKAAIKAAIEGKGVTVPDGTLLDGMASLIEGIEAGSGSKCIYGSFIPENDSSEIIIDDAFPYSTKPVMFGVAENGFSTTDGSHTLIRMEALIAVNRSLAVKDMYTYSISYSDQSSYIRKTTVGAYAAFDSTYRTENSLYNAMNGLINGDTKQIRFKPKSIGGYFLSGKTYYWFVLFGDDAT